MKTRIIFYGLFAWTLHAEAHQVDCARAATDLNAMVSADQQIREEWISQQRKPQTTDSEKEALQQRWHVIDSKNLKQLKEMMNACGWPATTEESHAAWLLTQHADSDVAFQRQAKGLIEISVKAGIAAPRDLAYLADRIAHAEGRPQEYGTQFLLPDRCYLVLDPVDDPDLVNRRRLAVGLQSLEAYEAAARQYYIPSDCLNVDSEPKRK